MAINSGPQNILSTKTYPSQSLVDFIFTERVSAEAPQSSTDCFSYGDAHPDTRKYPNHVVVFVSAEKEDKAGKKWIDLYYAANRESQQLYNFEYQGWAAGGKYERYTRKYLIRRDDWERHGSASNDLPDTPVGSVDPHEDPRLTGFVYFGDQMGSSGSQELDSVYVSVTRLFRKHCILIGSKYDQETGQVDDYEEQVVLSDGATGSGLDSDGNYTELTPINCDWSLKRTTKAIDPDFTKSYRTYISSYWPAVLGGYGFYPWFNEAGDTVKWTAWFKMSEDAYNGPTEAKIVESFSRGAPTLPAVGSPMMPTPLSYNGGTFNWSVPSCLHPDITVTENMTSGPVQGTFTDSWPATNYTTWPSSYVSQITTTPYKGGYKTKTVTLYKPPA